jgi:hypothetical protein
MRDVGFFFLLLVIWLAAQTFMSMVGGHDIQFAIAIALIFGTVHAIPSIIYLVVSDHYASTYRFPTSLIIYLVLVVAGCVLYLGILLYWKGVTTPSRIREWLDFFFGLAPGLFVAGIILLRRLDQLKQSQQT